MCTTNCDVRKGEYGTISAVLFYLNSKNRIVWRLKLRKTRFNFAKNSKDHLNMLYLYPYFFFSQIWGGHIPTKSSFYLNYLYQISLFDQTYFIICQNNALWSKHANRRRHDYIGHSKKTELTIDITTVPKYRRV